MARGLLLLGILIISFSAVFVRLAGVAPDTAAFFRAAYALPWLLVLWWAFARRRDTRPAQVRWQAVLAGVFLGLDLSFWHRTIETIGAGLSTVLSNTQVVFVGAAAWLLHRERPSRSALLTLPVVFAGVVLISGLGRPDAYGSAPLRGVVFGLLTGLTYGSFLLLLRYSNRQMAPPFGPMLDATLGATVTALVVGLVDGKLDFTVTWPAHGWLAVLALGSQVIGWSLISLTLPRLPALETSVLLLLQPPLTLSWGMLIFAERLSAVQWAGAVLVLGGVGWLSTRRSVMAPRPATVTA